MKTSTIRLANKNYPLTAAILDCDGVIFDSNPLKVEAYRQALSAYPTEAVEQLIAYHKERGGYSRYLKLQHFFTHIHPVDNPSQATAAALKLFGQAVRQGHRDLAPRPEALQLAQRLGGCHVVWVVSGADQEELQDLFNDHGIGSNFAGVLGSPTSKTEHVRQLITQHRLNPKQVLLVGDGRGDFEAAQNSGTLFVLLGEMSHWATGAKAIEHAAHCELIATWSALLERLGPLTT